MLKRQETVLSSSSRRENVPENHNAKTIGCMAGILQLVYKYQSRRRFLTFGKKQGKNNEDVASSASKAAKVPLAGMGNQASPSSMWITMRGDHSKEGGNKVFDVRRLSCEVPRSPTLPAEIRRPNSVNSPENFRTSTAPPPPPALVARLMGLEENIPSASEERRKLLGALERCDEDLKAIKKIIEALRSTDRLGSPPPVVINRVSVEGNASPRGVIRNDREYGAASGKTGDADILKVVKCCTEFKGELPSPISVLDDFTPSPLNNSSSCFSKRHITNGRMVQQQQQQKQKPQPKKNPKEEDIINVSFFQKITAGSFRSKCENAVLSTSPSPSPSPPLWSSKAMIESVDEVCRDIAWGEKREVGRIGLVLQDYICRDLIEEVVKEYLGGCCIYSLPLDACTRRLRF